ncbi:hypothetical protein HAX54_045475, partial [Datura stramonium]|nr:hypothetical protein [Datura stramonium]
GKKIRLSSTAHRPSSRRPGPTRRHWQHKARRDPEGQRRDAEGQRRIGAMTRSENGAGSATPRQTIQVKKIARVAG